MTTPPRDQPDVLNAHTSQRRAPHRRGRWVATGLALLLAVTLVWTAPIWLRILRDGAGQQPVVGAEDITLSDNWFTPSVVEVAEGTSVRFTWDDGDTPHDILFSDSLTAPLTTHGTFERTFDEPGDVTFRCTIHPGMNGRVVVTPEAGWPTLGPTSRHRLWSRMSVPTA
jgi:plastocyanin